MNKEDLEKERFKLHQALCERNETIEELEERINKAIEYIKDKYDEDLFDDTLTQFEDKLLNILRGEK